MTNNRDKERYIKNMYSTLISHCSWTLPNLNCLAGSIRQRPDSFERCSTHLLGLSISRSCHQQRHYLQHSAIFVRSFHWCFHLPFYCESCCLRLPRCPTWISSRLAAPMPEEAAWTLQMDALGLGMVAIEEEAAAPLLNQRRMKMVMPVRQIIAKNSAGSSFHSIGH